MPTIMVETTTVDVLLIGSNALVIISSFAVAYFTAKSAEDTAKSIHADDSKVIRALIRNNRNARHAKGVDPK